MTPRCHWKTIILSLIAVCIAVDAIRVGHSIASGMSFGAIGLHGLVAHIDGKVQIYYH